MKKQLAVLVSIALFTVAWTSSAQGADPSAAPSAAEVYIGGEDYWLDPFIVSVMGGDLDGTGVDASMLSLDCTGRISLVPDLVFNWAASPAVESLRVFFLSGGDPTLTIVTPSGAVLCNDDVNPLVLDPLIDIEAPEEGRYAVFVGSFEAAAIEPGFVVFTTTDLTPATIDLTALVGVEPNPEAISGDILPASVLLYDQAPEAGEPTALSAGFGTYTAERVSDGALPAFNINLGNPACTGFVNSRPTVVLDVVGDPLDVSLFFEGNHDSTLIVVGPDGVVTCNDDAAGASNLNPAVLLAAATGRYAVYVGTFSPGETVSGLLTVTEDMELVPTSLTSDMLGQ